MLEKVKFVCSKCDWEFDSKESCETHEKWCVPCYHLSLNITLEATSSIEDKRKISVDVVVGKTCYTKEVFEKKTIKINKSIYTVEESCSTNLDTVYHISKTVLRTVNLKDEINALRDRLITFIKSDIDKDRDALESEETQKDIDNRINIAISLANNRE